MTIDRPLPEQIPQLRRLWKEAFGDTDTFLDIFFHRAFSADRCRCITAEGSVVAALYWFDCQWQEQPLAYIYAVATAKSHRGQGLCQKLMEDTHRTLLHQGYAGSILAPQSASLFTMYEKFGYQTCSYIQEFSCTAGKDPLPLTAVTPQEYAAARRHLLPENSVLQEDVTLDFLSTYAWLYTGPDLALAAYPNEEKLVVCELLGAPQRAPQILAALDYTEGTFRIPGQGRPFTMYLPLNENPAVPSYFGLILD